MTTAHNLMVERLVKEKGANTHGFMKTMMSLMTSRAEDEEDLQDRILDFHEATECARVIPDAYIVTTGASATEWPEVDVYEVVDTHKLSNAKLAKYGWLADLDCTPRINLYVISVQGVVLEQYTCSELMFFGFPDVYDADEVRVRLAQYRADEVNSYAN